MKAILSEAGANLSRRDVRGNLTQRRSPIDCTWPPLRLGVFLDSAVSTELGSVYGLLETLLASSPLGFCLLSEDLRYVCVNESFGAMSGYAPAQLVGRSVREETPEFALMTEAAIRQVTRTRASVLDIELKFAPSAIRTEVRYALASFYPLLGNTGGIATIAVMILDITDRRIGDLRVRESEERYRLLYERSPVPIFVVQPDSGRILTVNEAAVRTYGYSKEEFLSLSVQALWLSDAESPHAGQERHRRKEGSEIDVEVTWTLITIQGTSAHLVLAHDVTERNRAEMKFRGLLESAPDAMVIVNAEGNIALINARTETLFGYRREELIGQEIEVLIPDRDRAKLPFFRKEYLQNPTSKWMGRGIELCGIRKDGTEFPVEISLSPLETPEGVLISSAIRDISERKQAEEKLSRLSSELARSNAALEGFASIASHDLREPLRMVKCYLNLLKNRNQGKLDSESETYIRFASDGARRMAALIDGLLQYSKVGAKTVAKRSLDLNLVLGLASKNLEVAIEESGARVTHDPLPNVIGDFVRLTQLFQNLLANAIKYRRTNEPPTVHISAQELPDEWLVCVKDNGIGFEMEFATVIFEQFRQIHGKGEYGGSGLGLATCQKIAEQHGGRIWAESEPGKGASFFFTIPKISKDGNSIA